jgi:hypothetical protein
MTKPNDDLPIGVTASVVGQVVRLADVGQAVPEPLTYTEGTTIDEPRKDSPIPPSLLKQIEVQGLARIDAEYAKLEKQAKAKFANEPPVRKTTERDYDRILKRLS